MLTEYTTSKMLGLGANIIVILLQAWAGVCASVCSCVCACKGRRLCASAVFLCECVCVCFVGVQFVSVRARACMLACMSVG